MSDDILVKYRSLLFLVISEIDGCDLFVIVYKDTGLVCHIEYIIIITCIHNKYFTLYTFVTLTIEPAIYGIRLHIPMLQHCILTQMHGFNEAIQLTAIQPQ